MRGMKRPECVCARACKWWVPMCLRSPCIPVCAGSQLREHWIILAYKPRPGFACAWVADRRRSQSNPHQTPHQWPLQPRAPGRQVQVVCVCVRTYMCVFCVFACACVREARCVGTSWMSLLIHFLWVASRQRCTLIWAGANARSYADMLGKKGGGRSF